MAKNLSWRRCSFAVGASLSLTACAPSLPKDATSDTDRRRPDGIAVDPLEYPPEARESADASEGVVALRTPLGPEAAKEATKSFLQAISREDNEGLRKVMTPDAMSINPTTRVRESSFYFFSRRFGRLDYFVLSNIGFWQEDRMELYRAGEGATLWADTVGPSANAPAGTPSSNNDTLDPTDVVVRVPLSVPRTSSGPMMGDELTLLLRRSGGRYVIHRVVEDFTLPP